MRNENPTVYSTQSGRHCPRCQQPLAQCTCKKTAPAARGDGTARVSRESKGRKGKTVTLISGLPLDDAALQQLASDLKRQCGAGGAVKNGVIEIQGDHRDTVFDIIRKLGLPVKKAGG